MHTLKALFLAAIFSLVFVSVLPAAPILYFSADGGDGTGKEIWSYNGTTATRVADIYPGGGSSEYPNSDNTKMIIYNNKLYFTASNGSNGYELWSYDGTSAALAADINPGSASSNPLWYTVYNNKLYFSAQGSTGGQALWSYDGTTASRVNSIYDPCPAHLAVYNNKLYFSYNDYYGTGKGTELGSYDGTTVKLVADIYSGSSTSAPRYLAEYNNQLYFSATNGSNGYELWSYNGTSVAMVADIWSGSVGSSPVNLTTYGDKLYFQARDGSNDPMHGEELWSYNGSTVALVADIYQYAGSSSPWYLTVYEGKLYFRAGTPSSGEELWSYDGMTATMAANINTGGGSSPSFLAVSDGVLYFSATNGSSGYELWSYDGDSAALAADINGGSSSSNPRLLISYDPAAGDDGTIYNILTGKMSLFGLNYTDTQIDLLSALYRDGKSNPDVMPSAVTIGDVAWNYIAGDLPGQAEHVIGDAWTYGGKYYYYLGSGLEGSGPLGGSGDVPEPSTLLLLLPFIGFGLRRFKRKNVLP